MIKNGEAIGTICRAGLCHGLLTFFPVFQKNLKNLALILIQEKDPEKLIKSY